MQAKSYRPISTAQVSLVGATSWVLLCGQLTIEGVAVCLHGGLLQLERDDIMRQYKNQTVPIMVATDVVGM